MKGHLILGVLLFLLVTLNRVRCSHFMERCKNRHGLKIVVNDEKSTVRPEQIGKHNFRHIRKFQEKS